MIATQLGIALCGVTAVFLSQETLDWARGFWRYWIAPRRAAA